MGGSQIILLAFIIQVVKAQFLMSASYDLNNDDAKSKGQPDLYPYQLRHRDATVSGETERHARMGERVRSGRHVPRQHSIKGLRLDIFKSKSGSRFGSKQNQNTDGPPQSNNSLTGKTSYKNDRLDGVAFGVYGTHTFAVDFNGFVIVQNVASLAQEDSVVYFFVVLQNKETGAIISNPLPFIITIMDPGSDIDRKGAAVTAGILVLVIIIIGIIIGVAIKAKHIARCPGDHNIPGGPPPKYSDTMFRGFLNFALVVDEETDDANSPLHKRRHDNGSCLYGGRNKYSSPDHANPKRTSSNQSTLAWLDLHYDDTVTSTQDNRGSTHMVGARSHPNVTFSLDCGTSEMVYADYGGSCTKGILKRSTICDENPDIGRVNHLYI